MGITAVGVAAAAVIATLVISNLSNNDESRAAGGHGATESPPPSGPTGTTEDWISAVCRPGTFANGHKHPNAVSGAMRLSALENTAIYIDECQSNFLMKNDLAVYRGHPYAVATDSDGSIWTFMSNSPLPSHALTPLTQYGSAWIPCPGEIGDRRFARRDLRWLSRAVSCRRATPRAHSVSPCAAPWRQHRAALPQASLE